MTAGDPDVLELLLRAPLEVLGRFAAASNATLLCRVGADDELLAVYKPARGERPLWDFAAGTLHRREVAAAVVDGALGLGMVPETVLRPDAPYGPGSVQRFVEHDPERHYFTLLEEDDPAIVAQLEAMIVFDLVVNNADRKAGHVLVDEEERVRLVDHGVCFHVEAKLRTVAWDLAGEPVPEDLRRRAGRAADAVRREDGDVRSRLRDLLTGAEVEATAARAGRVAALERFPPPEGPRPWPWPPI
jgi:uncharacterized repeat protein (TIGR03843 family)